MITIWFYNFIFFGIEVEGLQVKILLNYRPIDTKTKSSPTKLEGGVGAGVSLK